MLSYIAYPGNNIILFYNYFALVMYIQWQYDCMYLYHYLAAAAAATLLVIKTPQHTYLPKLLAKPALYYAYLFF